MKLFKRDEKTLAEITEVLKERARVEVGVSVFMCRFFILGSLFAALMVYFLAEPSTVRSFELWAFSIVFVLMVMYRICFYYLNKDTEKNWKLISLCKITMIDIPGMVGMISAIVRLCTMGEVTFSLWTLGVLCALCVFVSEPYIGWSTLLYNVICLGIITMVFYEAVPIRDAVCFIIFVALGAYIMSIRFKAATEVLERRKALQLALDQASLARDEALRANNVKTAFLSHMSHELRTPIGAIIGMNSAILRQKEISKVREYSRDVDSAARSLLSIVNDILDISRIEAGKLEILPVEYDLSSLIFDTVNMMRDRANDKGLKLITKVDPRLPHRLYGDDKRIKQVMLNILSNAVKYTEKGSVTLVIGGHVNENKLSLDVQVWDTGIGIKEEDLDKLFVEFQRIEEKRNRDIEGTGLGINIVCSMLNMMGGKLNVSSTYGEGSCFSFIIEQDIIDPAPIGSYEERAKAAQQSLEAEELFEAPGVKILVVDDNPVNRKVFNIMLEGSGAEIDEANGGEMCLRMVKKTAYDIIFLDHMMPEMDGMETLKRLKSQDGPCRNIPVIALTANASTGADEIYMAAGFNGYVTKPIDLRVLRETITNFCKTNK